MSRTCNGSGKTVFFRSSALSSAVCGRLRPRVLLSLLSRSLAAGLLGAGCLVFLLTLYPSDAAGQPISQKKENAATQQIIQQEMSKPLTALDWYNKGAALNNNSDQELSYYVKAVSVDPTFAPAYYNMGIIYMKRGMNSDAINSFNHFLMYSNDDAKKDQVRKALSELGASPGTQNNTTAQTASTDFTQRAVELYNEGSELNDNSDQEMQYYLQALALDPQFAPAHMNLGLLYYHRKDYGNALRELTRYIEYTNDPPAKRKEVLKLIEWLKSAVKSAPQQPASAQPAGSTATTGATQMKEEPLQ